ncbi:hypothetical protein TSAR_014097 [Trichomalopsis sarcophagae]|uniref:Uncharacterized protein n=1 Tax=Trichomalopsis sarcophagae TaxID=543379 RepID=A0A232FMX2_9HYME|nr:hypothetical protein TSAR_014097 [Trichomalopsis sarcophagae]
MRLIKIVETFSTDSLEGPRLRFISVLSFRRDARQASEELLCEWLCGNLRLPARIIVSGGISLEERILLCWASEKLMMLRCGSSFFLMYREDFRSNSVAVQSTRIASKIDFKVIEKLLFKCRVEQRETCQIHERISHVLSLRPSRTASY